MVKLVPSTANVKPGSPTFALVGDIEIIVGTETGVTEAHVVPTRIASIICAEALAAVPWRKAILSIVIASAVSPPLLVGAIVGEGSVLPNAGFTYKLTTSSFAAGLKVYFKTIK